MIISRSHLDFEALIQSLAKSHNEEGPKILLVPTPYTHIAAALFRDCGDVDISLSVAPEKGFSVEGEDLLMTTGEVFRLATNGVQRSIFPRLFRALA